MGSGADLNNFPGVAAPGSTFTVVTSGVRLSRLGIAAAVASTSSSFSSPPVRPRFFAFSAHAR